MVNILGERFEVTYNGNGYYSTYKESYIQASYLISEFLGFKKEEGIAYKRNKFLTELGLFGNVIGASPQFSTEENFNKFVDWINYNYGDTKKEIFAVNVVF